MTVSEAIDKIDTVKANACSLEQKLCWLSELDGIVKRLVHDGCEGDGRELIPYGEGDRDRELLVPAPFDGIYLHWLEAKIDYLNGEYGRYNNAILTYNSEFLTYAAYYTRNHKPKGFGGFRF